MAKKRRKKGIVSSESPARVMLRRQRELAESERDLNSTLAAFHSLAYRAIATLQNLSEPLARGDIETAKVVLGATPDLEQEFRRIMPALHAHTQAQMEEKVA